MSSPKVVMILSHFYPLLGGAEVQARRLGAALSKKGVELFILTRRMEKLPSYEVIDGIPVYRSIRTVALPFLWGMFYVGSVALFLYRKRNQYTIIHCHILQEFQSIVAILFKLLFKKKVVVKMSSSGLTSDLSLMKGSLAGKITLRLLKKADRIISLCSQSTAELLECGFPSGMVVEIPNGVDGTIFSGTGARKAPAQRIITFVGRFDSFKGVEYLIEAFKQVLDRKRDVMLKLVGSGVLEEQLRHRAAALGIERKVIFRGWQEDIAAELSMTDIFVLPSLSEGMSNVLLEAMACGLPVVATAAGGTFDVIRHRVNGIVVPPRDPSALGNALVELLENGTLARGLGAEARRTVEERYELAQVTDCYLELYKVLSPS